MATTNTKRPELKSPSITRAQAIDAHPPYDQLIQAVQSQQAVADKGHPVIHWFRDKDLRIQDNIALHQAAQHAHKIKQPLICLYLYCPEELMWHGLSPAKLDFMLETLRGMQTELKSLNIPLVMLKAEKRDQIIPTVLQFIDQHNTTQLYANYEYEIDELRRDIQIIEKTTDKVNIHLYHDQCVIPPKDVANHQKKPMRVFTPYHKEWTIQVKRNPQVLNMVSKPTQNDPNAKKTLASLFDTAIPALPSEKRFASDAERTRLRQLWPAGHAAALKRLHQFIDEKIEQYADTRSFPAKDSSSRMSPYFSNGVISIRETLSIIKSYNKNQANFTPTGCSAGVHAWVREIVFREFYRQMLVVTPHIAMHLPQNLRFSTIEYEQDEDGWYKWCEGQTGMPFIDAGMRQLKHEAYMHNRLRMNVASYLRTNLLIDYRRGERYFAEHLVDWDLSNNTYGWEPSYTVFNPVLQAEKNDPDGDYIRQWVPELKNVKGKAIFDPYHRLSPTEFEKLNYPKPHIDFQQTKTRAIKRIKETSAT